MKRKLLIETLFAALTLAATNAQAVALNPNGIGQVLLYPYYTVNVGNQTLISVVNTQNAGKVAKVRFREGYNGREVLDFNLYLSPYDVWTATVFDTANINGRASDGSAEAALLTPDNSCTDPAIETGTVGFTELLPDGRNFVAFSNHAYSALSGDGGPTELSRTRTGHIELIEMATVIGTTLTNITHDNGTPKNCSAIIGAQSSADYTSPTGGLFGSASIVNVQNGTLYGTGAEALSGFYSVSGNLFTASGSALPDLGSGDNSNISAGNAVSYVFDDNGSPITSSWPLSNGGSFDAVSSLFTAIEFFNEFELNPATGSVASEWIITFPTKYHYADPTRTAPTPPFSVLFGKDPAIPASACEIVQTTLQDREERTPQRLDDGGWGSPHYIYPMLCWEAMAIAFQPRAALGYTSSIFGAPLFANTDPLRDIGASGTSGIEHIRLNGRSSNPSTEGNTFFGLPVMGFLAKDFTNKNVTPGVLGNYAGLYRHHLVRLCTRPDGACH
ncbi:hypothetical protein ELE36_08045 [Pseudolysobacter antarcticus]|uniref:Uncharacterized protein n=1 Tax=Pseudolysobacter antarcticus TaxID=2511995 RepID=A0A411HIU2_9GAMM|nr:hypothetical protein [Pseudolysobacter antarcticus]QBB70317.1 hypothetical protein ELE36_08045 [Pseudolysobacter antarcticus]